MADGDSNGSAITAKERQALFIELASRDTGVTAQQAYDAGKQRGDSVTIEAYHNLGRRLAHRGLLYSEKDDRQTVFKVGAKVDGQWLDEEHLAAIVDPEYPLVALTVAKETARQLNEVPERIWEEVRLRLESQRAPELFFDAIKAYADDLRDALHEYILQADPRPNAQSVLRNQIETQLSALKQLTKHGLGLSDEAIRLPPSVNAGITFVETHPNRNFYDPTLLRDELSRRVTDEPFVVDIPDMPADPQLLVAAVDGSTRGGLLMLEGENGDFSLGHAPSVSINTSIAQINRRIRVGQREQPAFLRLPEKPEDMQQRDNRYTIMARLFFPDLSEPQYAHSVWNAMNLLENRAALQVMRRWYTAKGAVEVRPADVVLMDGTITPNDRDSNHYAQQDAYGRIVRDLIEVSSEIVQKSRDDKQVVAGVVKHAQLRVYGPVINYFIVQSIARDKSSQIQAWPLRAMNGLGDQMIVTRLLTAARKKGAPWLRTCLVFRPFHATTDYADRYSRETERRPKALLAEKALEANERTALGTAKPSDDFWREFMVERDPYVKLLENTWYGSFFLGAVPRLDQKQALPRIELLVPFSTEEQGQIKKDASERLAVLMSALRSGGFEVAADHSMFDANGWVDVLPKLLIDAHHTVKMWAAELLSRVQEYIGHHLALHLKGRTQRSVWIRPWTRDELENWVHQMTEARKKQGGAGALPDIQNSNRLE